MSDDDTRAKLDAFNQRLKAAQETAAETRAKEKPKNQADRGGLALAMRVGIELVSAVAVGLGIGYLLDEWLDTRPWLMLVFILLGGAAGILNVFRMAKGYGYAVGYQDPGASSETPSDVTTVQDPPTAASDRNRPPPDA